MTFSSFFQFLLWILVISDFKRLISGMIGVCFLLPIETFFGVNFFFGKTVILPLFVHFGQKIFTHQSKTFQQFCQICILRVQDKRLEGNLIWKKNCFYFSSDFGRQNVRLWAKFSYACFYWRSIYATKKYKEGKKRETTLLYFLYFLCVFRAEDILLRIKICRQCFQNCVLRTPRKALEAFLFEKSTFFFLFGLWAETIRTLGRNF